MDLADFVGFADFGGFWWILADFGGFWRILADLTDFG
jgi:hypothetical protein